MRTARTSSSDPANQCGSHRTETAAAPPETYAPASATGSAASQIAPADGDRRAAYVCALAYVEPGGREEIVHGRCEGELTTRLRGEGGFGYDPAFVPDDYPDERTMAELSPKEKDAISHRGRAARELVRKLAVAEVEARQSARPRGVLGDLFGRRGGAPR